MAIALGALVVSLLMAVVGWRARMAHPSEPHWLTTVATALMYLAPAAAILTTLYLVTDPAYERRTDSTLERLTYLDVNGMVALIPLLIPIGLAWVPAIRWDHSRRIALPATMGALVAAYCVVTGFSVGIYYVASASLLALASVVAFVGRERTVEVTAA